MIDIPRIIRYNIEQATGNDWGNDRETGWNGKNTASDHQGNRFIPPDTLCHCKSNSFNCEANTSNPLILNEWNKSKNNPSSQSASEPASQDVYCKKREQKPTAGNIVQTVSQVSETTDKQTDGRNNEQMLQGTARWATDSKLWEECSSKNRKIIKDT